eukprot:4249856-Amphidinium_carterae.3
MDVSDQVHLSLSSRKRLDPGTEAKLPTVDEKREDELTADEDAKSMCQKYIGQLMWLSTRTRPDISACLGILATLMVKRPREWERTVPAVVMDHLTKESYATLPVFAPVEPMIVVYTDAQEVEDVVAQDAASTGSSVQDRALLAMDLNTSCCNGAQGDRH